jgi:adenylate cyclase
MAEISERAGTRVFINRVNDWLMEQALIDADLETVILGACERIHAAGVPIVRAFFGFTILHPLYRATGITWQRDDSPKCEDFPHEPTGERGEGYRRSPFYYMEQHGLDLLRVRIDQIEKDHDFPIFKELRDRGVTDYLAFRASFDQTGKLGMSASWSTDRSNGFSEDDLEALLRVKGRLSVAAKIAIKTRLMHNVTTTYLGRGAGEHVLSGQIKRGDGQAIKAAIWFADIRGSTELADTVDRQTYIEVLNHFFDATGKSVHDKGGEILSFMGDGILAIFPTDGSAEASVRDACNRALKAALKAEHRLERLNAARLQLGLSPIRYGISLHLGEVMFGNVGARERLTFSAFGSAVNEVTRLDQLTKRLKEPMVISEDIGRLLSVPLRSLGEHSLRGVGHAMEVFAPETEAVPERRRQRARTAA